MTTEPVPTETVVTEALIPAPPERVAGALASPQALGTWLCDEAFSEKREGGALAFKWHDGRRRDGRWTAYAPPAQLAWRWREGLDGPLSDVAFELAAEGAGTRVRVARGGVAPGEVDQVAAVWREHLADLRAYLEDGTNGRMARRPMLGISPTDVTAELVAKHGLTVDHGVYLDGVAPGAAAETAGLRAGDVLVRVGEHAVPDWPALAAALTAHQAGDTVAVAFWRGSDQREVPVTLARRPQPPAPESADAARAQVRQLTDELVAAVRQATAGLTDAEAAYRPGPDEWSVRAVLGHLVLSERLGHEDVARLATDSDPFPWSAGTFDLRQRVLAAASLAELVARYEADLRETEALALAALDGDDTPALRGQVVGFFTGGRGHVDEHLAQIRAARAAAGAGSAPA